MARTGYPVEVGGGRVLLFAVAVAFEVETATGVAASVCGCANGLGRGAAGGN